MVEGFPHDDQTLRMVGPLASFRQKSVQTRHGGGFQGRALNLTLTLNLNPESGWEIKIKIKDMTVRL